METLTDPVVRDLMRRQTRSPSWRGWAPGFQSPSTRLLLEYWSQHNQGPRVLRREHHGGCWPRECQTLPT